MELQLERIFHPKGTNGILRLDDTILCYTIELSWKNNSRKRSCIPEGRYRLQDRYSSHHGNHIQVMNVPDRTFILVHPATDARKQIPGCISPVSNLLGPGKGEESQEAFMLVRTIVYRAIKDGESVWLNISQLE